jgi:hypothetical protein
MAPTNAVLPVRPARLLTVPKAFEFSRTVKRMDRSNAKTAVPSQPCKAVSGVLVFTNIM